MENLEFYKSQFHRGSRIHLNNAGLAPISRPALEKIKYWGQRFYEEGFYSDADYMRDVLHSRQSLARLINCAADEIAFFQSTAGGVSQIAFGFGLKAGDEVLLWDQEYSSNLYPWREACRRSQSRLVLVPAPADLSAPVETLLQHATARTKIVAVSWVQFQTGARTDIETLVQECHERNIFVFVDVMQGLGLHPFDFKKWDVDAIAGGSHKWLTAPVGVGFLALKKEHLARFAPLVIGSATYGSCDDPASLECVPKNDVTRFEAGSKQVLEITALGAACDLIDKVGVANLQAEALRLARRLRQGLEEQGAYQVHSPWPEAAAQASAIVNFSGTSLEKIKAALSVHPVNFAVRGPGLRLSPHAFNTDEEIDQVLQILRNL